MAKHTHMIDTALTRQEINALDWAVQQSAHWGGYYSGEREAERWFERHQAAAEAALRKLRQEFMAAHSPPAADRCSCGEAMRALGEHAPRCPLYREPAS